MPRKRNYLLLRIDDTFQSNRVLGKCATVYATGTRFHRTGSVFGNDEITRLSTLTSISREIVFVVEINVNKMTYLAVRNFKTLSRRCVNTIAVWIEYKAEPK